MMFLLQPIVVMCLRLASTILHQSSATILSDANLNDPGNLSPRNLSPRTGQILSIILVPGSAMLIAFEHFTSH